MRTMQQSRREEMRNVMNTAWAIARQTGETFETCLKRAWANSKLRSALKAGVVRFTFRKVDGSVGVRTITVLNAANQKDLFDRVFAARKKYFEDVIAKDPTQAKFRNGWLNRLNDFKFEP